MPKQESEIKMGRKEGNFKKVDVTTHRCLIEVGAVTVVAIGQTRKERPKVKK